MGRPPQISEARENPDTMRHLNIICQTILAQLYLKDYRNKTHEAFPWVLQKPSIAFWHNIFINL